MEVKADSAQLQEQSKVALDHQMDNKSLLQSDALYQYILETNVYPREPEPLKELRQVTARVP
jgi:caffeoyl-CoA O-methyltransferase